jgi:hypothetical protein
LENESDKEENQQDSSGQLEADLLGYVQEGEVEGDILLPPIGFT